MSGDGTPLDRQIEYYPYGGIYSMTGYSNSPHWFIGKEKDNTKELDFGPRYYSPSTGRFMAPDPILSGASAYSYAEGNPVMMYDPSGYAAEFPINNIAPNWDELHEKEQEALAEWVRRDLANEERNRMAEIYDHNRGNTFAVFSRNTLAYLGMINPDPNTVYMPGEYSQSDANAFNLALADADNLARGKPLQFIEPLFSDCERSCLYPFANDITS